MTEENRKSEGSVISMVNGRLGNIMFEISAALSYAKKHGKGNVDFVIKDKMLTPVGFYDKLLSKFRFSNSIDVSRHVNGMSVFRESEKFAFQEIPHYDGDVLLDGYFQSEKHFDKELVKGTFFITDEDRKRLSERYVGIEDGVGMSVRRGDYLKLQDIFTIPSADWYVSIYNKHFKGRRCFITSDDPNWCRENIKIDGAVFLDGSAEDCMMSAALCKDHIMSCSTFSWWCCWLDEREGAVNVFPDKWFNPKSGIDGSSIIPERWVKEAI